jgi:flagellar protein FliO/FliZ
MERTQRVPVSMLGKALLSGSIIGLLFVPHGMAKVPLHESDSEAQTPVSAAANSEAESPLPMESPEIEGPPADLAPPLPMEPPPLAVQPAEKAPTPVQETNVSEAPAGGSALNVVQAFGGLGLVLCLIAGCFFAARKFAPQYFARHAGGKNLQLLETLPMGEKRSIVLVQAGGKRLLLGSTANQISVIAQLDEPLASPAENPPAVVPTTDARKDPSPSFHNIYNLEKGRGLHPPGKAKTIAPDVRAKMKQLRESLER